MADVLSVKQIDYFNIMLIILAYIIAMFAPIELFIGSYIFLGPLHYLTEISWLHDRNYFTSDKYHALILSVITALSFIWPDAGYIALLIGFSYGLLYFLKPQLLNYYNKIFLTAVLVTLFLLFTKLTFLQNFFLFLPTIIHVFCFTAIFMLAGAIRNKNLSGYLAFACLIILALSFWVIDYFKINLMIVTTNYGTTKLPYLANIPNNFSHFLQQHKLIDNHDNIIRFIAFSYCYHYLNWFSKTNLIKWHNICRYRKIMIAIFYLMAISLYLYDYSLGIYFLFYLSFLHVLLEFPLNIKTIKQLFGH